MNEEDIKKFLDPEFPLLVKFKELAPGSYKHSQNVMSIVESIAMELKLNVDVMRIAGLYHDVGKMNASQYFSENQDESNPHDDLDPRMSYFIITKHVGDGIVILMQYEGFPSEALVIISQHHGDTVLRPFFNKSKSDNEDSFRYKSIKPNSTEASILMIVDSVEATAKALFNSGKLNGQDSRKKMIDDTINRLVDDGQIDELKIGTLKITRRILLRELDTIYHKRVDYEDDEKTIGEKKGKTDD